MSSQIIEPGSVTAGTTIVATYVNHAEAEAAVRYLVAAGIPVQTISIIGRHFETVEDIQGFYRPADAAAAGAGEGAWFGGIFGLMLGAFGFFVLPAAGAVFVLGPLAGMVAGAIGGAGIGALISALIVAGVPKDQALKYQERLQAGEFVLVVHGSSEAERAKAILQETDASSLSAHLSTEERDQTNS